MQSKLELILIGAVMYFLLAFVYPFGTNILAFPQRPAAGIKLLPMSKAACCYQLLLVLRSTVSKERVNANTLPRSDSKGITVGDDNSAKSVIEYTFFLVHARAFLSSHCFGKP